MQHINRKKIWWLLRLIFEYHLNKLVINNEWKKGKSEYYAKQINQKCRPDMVN